MPGSLTAGVQAGIANYQNSVRTKQLKDIADRQALLEQFNVLKSVVGMPAGSVRQMAISKTLAPMGWDPDSLKALSKMNDEEAQNLGEMVTQLLVDNPQLGRAGLTAAVKSGRVGLPELIKMGDAARAEKNRTLRATIMRPDEGAGGAPAAVAPAPAEPDASGSPMPAPPPMAAAPAPVPAADVDPEQAELAQLNTIEDKALAQMDQLAQQGEGITENEHKYFTAKLTALDKRRHNLLNAPGITETIVGPDGKTPLRVLFTKSGAVKQVLGKVPAHLEVTEITDADGNAQKVAVDKATGKQTVLGLAPSKEGGTLAERVAAAERKAAENPQDPRAQANLAQAKRSEAIEEKMRSSIAEATARGTKKAAMETPERPNQSVIEKFAEFDTNIKAAGNLLKGAEDKEIREVLGMSAEAVALRQSGRVTGKFLTTKQIDYLAELANTTGILRRFLVGQAQTNPEMANLVPLIPKSSDPIKVQVGKIQAIQRGIVNHRGKLAEGLESVNIMVPGDAGKKSKEKLNDQQDLPVAKDAAESAAKTLEDTARSFLRGRLKPK